MKSNTSIADNHLLNISKTKISEFLRALQGHTARDPWCSSFEVHICWSPPFSLSTVPFFAENYIYALVAVLTISRLKPCNFCFFTLLAHGICIETPTAKSACGACTIRAHMSIDEEVGMAFCSQHNRHNINSLSDDDDDDDIKKWDLRIGECNSIEHHPLLWHCLLHLCWTTFPDLIGIPSGMCRDSIHKLQLIPLRSSQYCLCVVVLFCSEQYTAARHSRIIQVSEHPSTRTKRIL